MRRVSAVADIQTLLLLQKQQQKDTDSDAAAIITTSDIMRFQQKTADAGAKTTNGDVGVSSETEDIDEFEVVLLENGSAALKRNDEVLVHGDQRDTGPQFRFTYILVILVYTQ